MAYPKVILAASILLIAVASAESNCWRAYRKCEFRFNMKKQVPTFYLGRKADTPFSPRIVAKKNMKPVGKDKLSILGVLNTNRVRVEIVLKDQGHMAITKLKSHPRLRPTHIKPLAIVRKKSMQKKWYRSMGSGLGHQMMNKSQKEAIKGKCVRIYFMEYELLNKERNVRMNFNNVPKKKNKCVVFRTK